MNVFLLQKKVQERLNKLDSFDYGNIEPWQIVEAFNKAQLQWVRRQLQGINQTRTGAEGSIRRIDDLRFILTTSPISVSNIGIWYEGTIPDNYMEWCRVSCSGKDSCCPDRSFIVYIGEEANRDIYLSDSGKQPDFEWKTTFATIENTTLRIYTNALFNISDVSLTYYRYPTNIAIAGTPDIYNPPAISTTDIESEAPEDVQEILVDECVAILSGDIQQYQVEQNMQQSVMNNT